MRHPGPVSLRHRTPPRVDGVRRPTVLIGVDGSEASWSALAWACGETRRLDGRAIAVHVSPSTAKSLSVGAAVPGFDAGGYAAEVDHSHDELADALAAEVLRRTAGLGVEVDFLHVHGDVAERLGGVRPGT